jgi:hypothetical protein
MSLKKIMSLRVFLIYYMESVLAISIIVFTSMPLVAMDESWCDAVFNPEYFQESEDESAEAQASTESLPADIPNEKEGLYPEKLVHWADVSSCSRSIFCPVTSSEDLELLNRREGFQCFEKQKYEDENWQCFPDDLKKGTEMISNTCPALPFRDQAPVEQIDGSPVPMPLSAVRSISAPTTKKDFEVVETMFGEFWGPQISSSTSEPGSQPYRGPDAPLTLDTLHQGCGKELKKAFSTPNLGPAMEYREKVGTGEFTCFKVSSLGRSGEGHFSQFVLRNGSRKWYYNFPEGSKSKRGKPAH